ncbi:MAG: hypothetical protein SR1Q5_05995 [Quinella sp. 1Q5]|nr:hypothetical protein [Quinella sp. 1Q5]
MRRQAKRRGQVVVFYALMIPIFLFAGGVGLDLGWYYLNVSRLQHAADASVIVGARVLAIDFEDYVYKSLVDKYPGDKPDPDNRDTTAGDEAVAKYALKNLSSDAVAVHNGDVYTMKDNYTRGDPTITMTPSLYKDVNYNYYYVVHLSEDIHHFFLGFLDDMNAGVVSVAKLKYVPLPRPQGTGAEIVVPEGTNILAEMYKIEDVSVIRNWEWQKNYEKNATTKAEYKTMTGQDIYSGKWSGFENVSEKDPLDNATHVLYLEGKKYRAETLNVEPGSIDDTNKRKEDEVDSLNLDFNPDLKYKFGENQDWDIGNTLPAGKKTLLSIQHDRSSKIKKLKEKVKDETTGVETEITRDRTYSSNDEETFKLRIHATFNFETPYKKRASNKYDTKKNPEDVLYVRIESEPINPLSFKPSHDVYSTVRQIIININQSNMDSQYRPLMFFYSGPEKKVV